MTKEKKILTAHSAEKDTVLQKRIQYNENLE